MQLTCRRCNGSFTVPGPSMAPCPACGSIDVYAQQPQQPQAQPTMRSPLAKTTERSSFSAPVSQPASPMPPSAIAPYQPQHSPSYPAPPPQYSQHQQPQYQPQYQQPQYPQYQQPHYPQPVQVVIQNHIGAPMMPAPYAAMAPYARRKDAGVATLLSFFLPGAGQLYNGQTGKGLAFLLVSIFVNFPLMFIGVGFITGLITWIWAMIDAHSSAERINRGEIVV